MYLVELSALPDRTAHMAMKGRAGLASLPACENSVTALAYCDNSCLVDGDRKRTLPLARAVAVHRAAHLLSDSTGNVDAELHWVVAMMGLGNRCARADDAVRIRLAVCLHHSARTTCAHPTHRTDGSARKAEAVAGDNPACVTTSPHRWPALACVAEGSPARGAILQPRCLQNLSSVAEAARRMDGCCMTHKGVDP